MSYGIELRNSAGALVFSSSLSVGQVKTVYTLGSGLTNIIIEPADMLFVGYAGYAADCGVSGRTVGASRYIDVVTTAPIKVLVLSSVASVGVGSSSHGLNIFNSSGNLQYTTTRGILEIDTTVTQTVNGDFYSYKPSVSNVYSTPHLLNRFISANVPYYVTGTWEDGNTCGINLNITHTHIGFKGSQGAGYPYDGLNTGLVFSVLIGTFYDV